MQANYISDYRLKQLQYAVMRSCYKSLYLHKLRLVKSVNDPISVGMVPFNEFDSMDFKIETSKEF